MTAADLPSVFVLSANRTPIGSFQGALSGVTATQLGATAIRAAVAASGIANDRPDEVYMGCVLPAGLGQAPARQAALSAGLPTSVPATTVNKMCGSGMKAVMLAADQLAAGRASVIVAGGLESMSNAPYLLMKARAGYRLGHGELLDHMYTDGLQSPWDQKLMGEFADATAERFGFTRERQDAFAAESVRRALQASDSGQFSDEIAPVSATVKRKAINVSRDETPYNCDIKRIPEMKPAFRKDGTVTAASSSSISDGAAALVLASGPAVAAAGARPLARIVGWASHANEPEWFTTAPVGATRKVLQQCGWAVGDVDLFEVNEAFAVVAMAAMHELGIEHARLNINGGACALGHPIGATGARLLVTLIHALRTRGLRRGVASLCIGGGEATAVAVELC